MFLVHRTGGGKYICAIHLHNNMLRQLQQPVQGMPYGVPFRGMRYGGGVYAGGLRRSCQGSLFVVGRVCLTAVAVRGMPYGVPAWEPYGVLTRGHYSLVKGNPLKLLKNTLATKHNRNDNDYHLHLQQNICPTFKLSFPAILRPIQGAAIHCPILPYPGPYQRF